MNPLLDPVIEIFNEALALEPSGRAAYLDQACASDDGLREQIVLLLQAHESAGAFLDDPVIILHAGISATPVIGEKPGDQVGKYRLIEQIGEGGCGVVFLAGQQEPVVRQVALKVVKPGMDTRSVIAQFESERQALAMMEHPHIAQVHDAGATDAGRPYFVMELVRGTKITDYCDHHALTIQARLELFVKACHAIQHAHQKGIIHRDIKPSNILVSTTGEGTPLPKVIDFGVAKATTGQRLTDKTFFTAFEMLIGTPTYMSPEQAGLKSVDVDTRTDIYSLGVLLYELLTGTTPFDVREISEVGLDEVRRDIQGKEPVRPSVRLKTMPAPDLADAAQHRQVEPSRLIRLVHGDLDWIVMKALEKDRTRRYPTANALAVDVQHLLADEPVLARPPSTLYQVSKLVARNRLLVGSLAVIALLLVTGLATVSVSLARERRAHEQAEAEKRTARVEAAKSTQVSTFLSNMMSSVSPSVARGRDTTILRELLAETDKEISSDLANQPEVEAELRVVLGRSYGDLGDFPSAERMLRRALEIYQAESPPDPRDVANTTALLGHLLVSQDHQEEAERLLLLSRDLWQELGAGEGQGAMLAMENLAMLRSRQHRNEEAESLMRRVYDWRLKNMSPDHPDLINARANLAVVAYGSNKFPEAEQMFREVAEARERLYGDSYPGVAMTLQNLATAIAAQGRNDEAKECLSRAVALFRTRFYPAHPYRLNATLRMAGLHREAGAFSDAELLYREVMKNGGYAPEDYNPTVTSALRGLVATLHDQKKDAEVETWLDGILTPEFSKSPRCVPVLELRSDLLARAGRWREAAADAAKLVGLEPGKHERYHTLAPLLVAAGDDVAYRALCAEMLSRFAATTDGNTADRMAKDCLIRPGAVEDLAAVGRMADLALKAGVNDVSLPLFKVCKALAEFRQGNFAAAVDLAEQVGSSLPDAEVEALAVQAMALQRMNQPEKARTLLARCAAAFEANLPKLDSGNLGDHWRDWIIARELLGEARATVGQE